MGTINHRVFPLIVIKYVVWAFSLTRLILYAWIYLQHIVVTNIAFPWWLNVNNAVRMAAYGWRISWVELPGRVNKMYCNDDDISPIVMEQRLHQLYQQEYSLIMIMISLYQ